MLAPCLCHNLATLVHAIHELREDRAVVLVAPGGRVAMPRRDLSLVEQENVRVLMRVLHVRLGNWTSVERALPVSHGQRVDVMSGRSEVSATFAFRVAKALDVSLHHVLS